MLVAKGVRLDESCLKRKAKHLKYSETITLNCCRVVDDEILLTMDDGRSALKVLQLDGKEVVMQKLIVW